MPNCASSSLGTTVELPGPERFGASRPEAVIRSMAAYYNFPETHKDDGVKNVVEATGLVIDPRTESPLHRAGVGARLEGQSFGQSPKLRLNEGLSVEE